MARSEQHARDCWYLMNKRCLVVHKFLDQFVGIFPVDKYGGLQRVFLHNLNGISLCKILYGEDGELAAKIHIVRDWHGQNLEDKTIEWVEENLDKAVEYFEQQADKAGRRRDHFDLKMN
jgi:hypothetical protein